MTGSALRRRWPAALAVALLLSAAAVGVSLLLRPRSVWSSEARMTLGGERKLVPWTDVAPFLPAGVREFDAMALTMPDVRRHAARFMVGPGAKPEEAGAAEEVVAQFVRVDRSGERFVIRSSSPYPDVSRRLADSFVMGAIEASQIHAEAILRQALDGVRRKREETARKLETLDLDPAGSEAQVREVERRIVAAQAAAAEIERLAEEVLAREQRARGSLRALEADEHRLRELLPTGDEEDGLRSPVLDRIRVERDRVRTEIALKGLDRAKESPEYRRLEARLGELAEALRGELSRARATAIVRLRETQGELETEMRGLDERRLRKTLELRDYEEDRRAAAPRKGEIDGARRDLATLDDLAGRIGRAIDAREGRLAVVDATAGESVAVGTTTFSWLPWAILVSVLTGVAAAVGLESRDTRIRGETDVRRWLNLPCLALVPDGSEPLTIRESPESPRSSIFSTAATLLKSYLGEREFKVVVVTGADVGEGKTTTTVNLATGLARKGYTVALLDGDLKAPRIHEIFGTDSEAGMSTVLLGGEVDPELNAGATELAPLKVLPAGPTSELPPELMESARLGQLLRILREKYDVVIIDAPPIGAAGDALVLAKFADTVVWVVRSGTSDRRRLAWAKQLLKGVRADVVGVVLTGAPEAEALNPVPYALVPRP